MSLQATTEQAVILRVEPSSESFYKLDLLTKETGYILCLKRISKKSSAQIAPDLFDTADILLDPPRQGGARFIKEYHLLQRRSSIGQSYRTLQCASEFCTLIAKNAQHMAEPTLIYEIAERSLDAFAGKKAPEIISLKAHYILLKDEGYPVREFWWPQLPERLRKPALQFINDPVPNSTSEEQIKLCMEIGHNLLNWLSRETDLILNTKH